MPAQTQAELATAVETATHIPPADRAILHDLASQVADLAALPIQSEKRALWTAHNDLQPTRPLIFCDPENGWNEIIPPHTLACSAPLARNWEMRLRKLIYWGAAMGDDRVIDATFDVPHVHTDSGWGLQETKVGGDHGGAFTWESPLKSYDDLDKLHFPTVTVDRQATAALAHLAREVVGHALNVRVRNGWWWTLGMTWTLVSLRGMEQIMLDMYDEPDNLKCLMAFLRDGTLARLDSLQQQGLLAPNHDGGYVGSGGFGNTNELHPRDPNHITTADMWGFAESQETIGISPDMFEEFVFPYQQPILERFSLNCYGCCEPVHNRWHVIQKLPRLRRISCSPWVDIEQMAANLGPNYIFSWKPNPAHLAVPDLNEDLIRQSIRRTIAITRAHNCRLEIIMKDNHTLANTPSHASRWCQIAREEATRSCHPQASTHSRNVSASA